MTATLHACLGNDVAAFDFREADLKPLTDRFPGLKLVIHEEHESLEQVLAEVEFLATWEFRASWLALAPRLKAVFTPAAGRDWIEIPMTHRVKVVHGTFHGPMLAESLLAAMLYLNRDMPGVLENQRARAWNRNFQGECRRLFGQTAVLIGYGAIGFHCGKLLSEMGMQVYGLQRQFSDGVDDASGVRYVDANGLDEVLAQADHVVLLLPGNKSTNRFMNPARLAALKPGAFLYNFGRGNSLQEEDLLQAIESGQCNGAVLDVTPEEPPSPESLLWQHPRVLVMPHSSCVYAEYRPYYVAELKEALANWLK